MCPFETKRREYRPEHIRVLFVGESPPANGTFFYCGNSLLARYTRTAFEAVYGPYDDMPSFLRAFKDLGCYLEDLSTEPINHLPRDEREVKRNNAIPELSARIREHCPEKAIIGCMMAIEAHVHRAVSDAGVGDRIPVHFLPFPAQGHQQRYVNELAELLRKLGLQFRSSTGVSEMNYPKDAHPDVPIQPLLAKRWSPCGFANKDVAAEDLRALLEAARWAPSSYNEQPWRYFLARRSDPDAFAKALSCLVEGNQVWAKHAPVLLLGVAMLNFERNGKPNKATFHDLGLAAGNICVEATARGLFVHQMIGIVPERVRELYNVPEDAQPLTALAIGHLGDGGNLPEAVRERDLTPRTRRPVNAFVYGSSWGEPA